MITEEVHQELRVQGQFKKNRGEIKSEPVEGSLINARLCEERVKEFTSRLF